MTLKTLKGLQIVVAVCVIGILVSFGMSIAVAVRHHQAQPIINPATIPTPAMPAGR